MGVKFHVVVLQCGIQHVFRPSLLRSPLQTLEYLLLSQLFINLLGIVFLLFITGPFLLLSSVNLSLPPPPPRVLDLSFPRLLPFS